MPSDFKPGCTPDRWAVDRGTGATSRLGSLPAPHVASHCPPAGFGRQQDHHDLLMIVFVVGSAVPVLAD
jgi:hypothetical protein